MSRTLPTEESLGLSPTDEELGAVVTHEDDDVPLNDDVEPALAPEKPGPEKTAKAEPEGERGEPEKAAEPEKPDEQPKQVDVRALQEARAEAREAKRQAAILEQRWNDFMAAQQQPAKPEPEQPTMPGPDDPMGRLNWTAERIAAFEEQQRQTVTQQAEAQRQEQAYQQAFATVDADYRAASAADPTVAEAYNALLESQGKELLALGYTVPQAQAELARIEREHVMYVAHRGISIADHIKSLASVRGWQPKAQQAPAPQKTDIAAVAAAQQRHQSLSDAGGGEAVAPLDAKALVKMSDKEFKAWMSKKGNEAKFDEIMGG